MTLERRIIAEIREHGPMTVARYMELVLGDPEFGYYMHKDPLGLAGDFVTAPEISQIFGELCGIWAAEAWSAQGLKQSDLVELGPGRGTLMMDALRATKHVGGFHAHTEVTMVEMSPVLRDAQQQNLHGKHPHIAWQTQLPKAERPLLLLANEFFDALPIHQYVASADGWHERVITVAEKGDTLQFSTSAESYGGQLSAQLPAGTIVERCPIALDMMTQIATRIARFGGAALIIDYGYFKLEGMQSAGDTLQAVRSHQYHDVLHHPGKADVTAHVDFTALAEAAVAAGAQASPILSQREFLRRMGGKQRMDQLLRHAQSDAVKQNIIAGFERLTAHSQMGDLFLVLAITPKGVAAPVF